MLHRLLFLVCWLLLACQRPHISPEPQPAPPSAVDTARPEPLLWTARSATAAVTLFGSVHVAREDMYPLPQTVYDAFDASDALVLEVLMDEASEAAAGAKMLEAALLPKADTVWNHLDPETATLLRQSLKELDLAESSVEAFKPWFVAVMIMMARLEAAGFVPDLGIDRHFQDRAGDKELLELESIDEQMALLAALNDTAEKEELRQSLAPDVVEELSAIAAEWKLGKTALLEQQLREMQRDYPAAYAATLTERNKRMARKLADYLRTNKRYFVVIGAAHLVGPDSVIAELRRLGVAVSGAPQR